jgi:hypothetical protein
MARYFFDVHGGTNFQRDDEGTEIVGDDAAVQAAARSAAELGTGRLARGDTRDAVVEVRDKHGRRMCTVTASMKIGWHVSS